MRDIREKRFLEWAEDFARKDNGEPYKPDTIAGYARKLRDVKRGWPSNYARVVPSSEFYGWLFKRTR